MAYSYEVFAAANSVFEKRRRDAQLFSALKKSDIYTKIPEIKKMDEELSKSLAELSILVLKGQKDLESTIAEINIKTRNIEQERAKILSENGFDPDCLEPKYTCGDCNDTGRRGGILCHCYKEVCREQAQKELAASSGSALCSFDNFDLSYYVDNGAADGTNPRRKMNNYYDFCVKYANDFFEHAQNIVMLGKTGLGKTHLSLSIARVVVDKGYGVCYAPAQKLISNLEKEHFTNSDDRYIKRYTECDLLIIDDLGAEFNGAFVNSAIGNLINERLYENRPTIISTNLTTKELTERYSERTASRILGEYRKLFFVGEDIRFLKNK